MNYGLWISALFTLKNRAPKSSHPGGKCVGRHHWFGGCISRPANDGDKMTITPDQAVKAAQDYLDTVLVGSKVETTPLAFYGFYTLDILRDGKVTGMLSVNGYTGQVWLHRWHGDFVAQTSQQ